MDDTLKQQLPLTLRDTQLSLGERYQGKVRDVYRQGDRLFLVATDRLSAFDRVLTTIPFKGEVLNRLAQFWFHKTAHVAANHVLDVPDPNVTVARACEPIRLEVVVRAFLTGSLWRDYVSSPEALPYGLSLPLGMKKDERFDKPILTPSTKAAVGEHDTPLSRADAIARGLCSARDWDRVAEVALGLFDEGQRWAQTRGLLLVDTKYEFGKVGDSLYVIDEIHTPDSSRFWVADEYERHFAAATDQKMLDKENVRQWLIRERSFSGHGEPPAIPDDVRLQTARTYLTAFERITGAHLTLMPGDVQARIGRNLAAKGYL
jgi:phosphoribosylaminoimidazole-succinocarboxamide synthase